MQSQKQEMLEEQQKQEATEKQSGPGMKVLECNVKVQHHRKGKRILRVLYLQTTGITRDQVRADIRARVLGILARHYDRREVAEMKITVPIRDLEVDFMFSDEKKGGE